MKKTLLYLNFIGVSSFGCSQVYWQSHHHRQDLSEAKLLLAKS
jgi:hypothetical protein